MGCRSADRYEHAELEGSDPGHAVVTNRNRNLYWKDPMKRSIAPLSFLLLAGAGLAGALTTRAFGQEAQAAPGATAVNPVTPAENGPTPAEQKSNEYMTYRMYFSHILTVDKIATKLESEGKNEQELRSQDQRESGLTEEEWAIVKQAALDCDQALKGQLSRTLLVTHGEAPAEGTQPQESTETAAQLIQRRRAILKSDVSPGDAPNPVIGSEDVIRSYVAQLRQTLGDESFAKLDKYVRRLLGVHDSNVIIQRNVIIQSPDQAPTVGKPDGPSNE
jgi:hypothetical protein